MLSPLLGKTAMPDRASLGRVVDGLRQEMLESQRSVIRFTQPEVDVIDSKSGPATFESEYQTRFPDGNGAPFSPQERKQWEAWCRELIQERDQLRARLEALAKERDAHAQALQAVLPTPDYPFTKEELLAQIDDKPSFAELVEEVRHGREIADGGRALSSQQVGARRTYVPCLRRSLAKTAKPGPARRKHVAAPDYFALRCLLRFVLKADSSP